MSRFANCSGGDSGVPAEDALGFLDSNVDFVLAQLCLQDANDLLIVSAWQRDHRLELVVKARLLVGVDHLVIHRRQSRLVADQFGTGKRVDGAVESPAGFEVVGVADGILIGKDRIALSGKHRFDVG